MAILEQIRNKSGLAVGAVGVALLLFVISDALNSNSSLFGGRGSGTSMGEIDGEKIDIKYFEAKLKENEENYKQRIQSQSIDANTQDMMREQTWTQILQEGIWRKEYDQLGVKVTNDELFDLVQGENPHPQIQTAPIFKNKETGAFDRTILIRFLKQMMESTDDEAKTQWAKFEDGLVKEAESKKLTVLIKKGIYATNIDVKSKMIERTRSVEMEIVPLPFMNVPDTAIVAGDEELMDYFKKNRDRYREKETLRKIDFVLFDVIPSLDDTLTIRKWAADQRDQFATATNDSLYTDLNSETKFDTITHPLSFYPAEVADSLFSTPLGTVVGPLYRDNKYSIYKVSGVQEDTIYNMRASHILFKTEGPTKADTLKTMKKAQDVLAEIKKGAAFADKASQYGTDGTASKGGDLGWFKEGAMVKEFGDWVRSHNKNDIGIVKTQFGIHIVKVTGDKSKKLICAGMVDRSIKPGEATNNKVYNEASQFAVSLADKADFDKLAAEKNVAKRQADNVKESDKSLAGFGEAREIVRWVYTAKMGEVSDVFTLGEKYLVAKLTGVKEKNKADFENAKERVTLDYRKDKKAEQLMVKAEEAMKGAKKLQDVASKLQVAVAPVTNQTFENGNLPYVGLDNLFVGTIFGTRTFGKMLGPFRGDNGVYVYNITKFIEPTAEVLASQRQSDVKNEVQNNYSTRLEGGYFDVLKDFNHVMDNRQRFY